MERLSGDNGQKRGHLYLIAIIFFIGIIVLSISPASLAPSASAANVKASTFSAVMPCQNLVQPPPDSRSLLVVLLDRSGSLVDVPTDPELYSASVTRALADLWPGKMAVVAFNTVSGSGHAQLVTIGPFQVGGDVAQRTTVKNRVQTLPKPHLGTPTGPAMDKALEIIRNERAPLSRVVLITDGAPGFLSSDPNESDPGGKKEEQHIRNELLKQFCNASVPVDTVGLKTDQNANNFLSDIATGTDGVFQSVQDARDLANAVLSLDGKWQRNRDYRPLQLQPDNTYHETIGELARSLHLFAFRSSDSYKITLKDPNGQLLNPVEDASDKHYVTETLDFPTPKLTGDYTIAVRDDNGALDTGALVYAFVDSQLQVQLLTPTETTQIPINQSVSIQVRLLADQVPLPQLQGKAAITAYVTYTVSGQRHSEPVNLQQRGQQNLFSGQILAPAQPVPLHFEVIATYGGVPAETDITTQMVCGLSLPCLVQQYWISLLIALPILLLLLVALTALLIWRRQPAPCGILRTPPPTRRLNIRDEDEDDADIPVYLSKVGASRPLTKRIFQRSALTSYEIESHRDSKGGFDFDSASFELIFKGNCAVDIRVISGGPVMLNNGNDTTKLDGGESHLLESGSSIVINNKERATFSSHRA